MQSVDSHLIVNRLSFVAFIKDKRRGIYMEMDQFSALGIYPIAALPDSTIHLRLILGVCCNYEMNMP